MYFRHTTTAYGANPDQLDEYLHMGRATSMECLNNFCKCVYYLYQTEYLRKPASEDVQRLVNKHEQIHGFFKHNVCPFSVNKIKRIMYACVILHNMIVQDNGNAISDFEEDYLSDPTNVPTRTWDERVATQMRVFEELRDRRMHH
uniref:uncharacterized protein LOC122587787 n=1 Tax=Erigeron canadensis TaxID=72917 RepID=UPI001CB93968|nr:uncharacterized protein LOC122587787 [Erigeron canadensis]